MEELEKILFVKVFLKKIKIEDKGKNLNRGIFERLDKISLLVSFVFILVVKIM